MLPYLFFRKEITLLLPKLSHQSNVCIDKTNKDSQNEPAINAMKMYKQSTWLDMITCNWMIPIIQYTQNNDLTSECIGQISESESSKTQGSKLSKSWEQYKDTGKNALLKSVFNAYRYEILLTIVYCWVCIFLETYNIFILKEVMDYIDGENNNINRALMYVVIMALFELGARTLHMAVDRIQLKVASRVCVGIQKMVYSKIFKISSATNKKYKKGDLNNLVNSDPDRMARLLWELPHITSLPFLLVCSCASLFNVIGYVAFYAVAIVLFTCFCTFYICKLTEKLWKQIRKNSDERSNVLTEIIENIKVIKMNSYTECFTDKIMTIRNKEFVHMIMGHLNNLPHHVIHNLSHYFLVFGVFFITVFKTDMTVTVPIGMTIIRIVGHMRGHTNHFPHFANGLTDFFVCVNRIQDFLKCEEIEYHKVAASNEENNDCSVKVEKSNFFWGLDEAKDDDSDEEDKKEAQPKRKQSVDDSTDSSEVEDESKTVTLDKKIALKQVDLKIKKGEFIAVIGEVGSGKSSLLSSVLGEMLTVDNETIEQFKDTELDLDHKTNEKVKEQLRIIKEARQQQSRKSGPKIRIDGAISLIEQTPFILNATIRENILFGEELNEERYNKVVEACQLGRDLEILKGGDLTEIGEHGVNLSGGQKARVSIARAVYSNKDIILMDDPLSALDAHVKRKVFEKVCCGELKEKTKILVTHAIDFLDRVDKIIIMHKGQIANMGTYEELKSEPRFQKIIKHITKTDDENKDENKSESSESSDSNEDKPVKNYLSKEGHKTVEHEEDEEFELSYQTYLKYASYCSLSLVFLFLSTFMIMVQRPGFMYQDYSLISWVKSFSLTNDPDYQEVFRIVGIAIFLMIWSFCGHFNYIAQAYLIDTKLFKSMIMNIMRAPINLYFDKTTSGKVLKRFNSDLEKATRDLPGCVTWNMHDLFRVSMTIVLVGYYSPLCLLLIPFMLLSFGLVLKNFVVFKSKIDKLENLQGSPCDTHINESIDGITTVRTFKRIAMFEDKFCELKDRDHSIEILDRFCNNWLVMRLNLICVIFISISYSYFVYTRDQQDTIIVGLLLGKLCEFQWNMCGLVHSTYWLNKNMKSFQKCLSMENIPQEAEQHKDIPVDENDQQWMSKGHIKFENYSVKYRPDTETVLKNIDIDIKPGEKVGIVGRTGAGKSTLCLALCRIIEKLEGSIKIDGVDIAEAGLADLRDRITIIPQEPVLFENTLRFNLDPQGKCSDKDLLKILEKAGLESLLERDGNGLEFKITSKGGNLSAGEKALVCICRAALRKSKVVLMDEATASIDVTTEESIQKLVSSEFKEATVLTVAHRLNTIINSDKIMVMSYGEVIEFDSPNVLRNDSNSAFYELLQQFNK